MSGLFDMVPPPSTGHVVRGERVAIRSAFEPRLDRALCLWGLWVAYLAFAVATVDRGWPIACPFRRLTGFRCPLCGLTTAVGRLLRGNAQGSLRAHPAGVIALPLGTLWLSRELRLAYGDRSTTD